MFFQLYHSELITLYITTFSSLQLLKAHEPTKTEIYDVTKHNTINAAVKEAIRHINKRNLSSLYTDTFD